MDIASVVRMFALPDEGNLKGDDAGPPLPDCYLDAFASIQGDPNNALYVAEMNAAICGAFHLTFIRYVAFRGGMVAQLENVVVDPAFRRRGVGKAMMEWAIDEARRRGCFRVQLTTRQTRKAAQTFYEQLGFVPSHVGLRLRL
jgi:GNAT superfamily N-acetyltransferase